MKEKTIEIIAPEGYEVDKEKSSYEKIVFRALPDKGLPKTYDALQNVRGYCVGRNCEMYGEITLDLPDDNVHNTWPTREEAEASIALAQLCQLRDRYNGQTGIADCDYSASTPSAGSTTNHTNYLFRFKTVKLRDEFMKNFADLIEKAKPLLG